MISLRSFILTRLEQSFIPDLNKRLAEYTLQEIEEEFANESDPYDAPWAKRLDNLPHPVLNKTGTLKDSFEAVIIKNGGFIIKNRVSYAIYHQKGTGKMVKRQILPENGEAPAKWMEGYYIIIEELLRELKI